MNKKKLVLLVSTALAGLSPVTGYSAAVDNDPANDTFATPPPNDTWPWQTESNDANIGGFTAHDETDFFELPGFNTGDQVRVTFEFTSPPGPNIRLEVFDTTEVLPNDVDLNSVLDTLDLDNATSIATGTVAAPPNGLLGLKVTGQGEIGVEGYRITIEVLSTPQPVPVPAWPAIPLLGAAALSELRRRQKRKKKSRIA